MKKYNRVWASILVIFFLTGCLEGTLPSENTNKKPDIIITISVDSGSLTQTFNNFLDDFSKRHNITIDIIQRPSGRAGETIVTTELLTENMADILLFNSGALFLRLDPTEYFIDISDEFFTKKYKEEYRRAVSAGGRTFGLPVTTASAIGFFYIKSFYEEHQLNIPSDWETFLYNLNIAKENQKTPILAPFKDQWVTQFYWLAGGYRSSKWEDNINSCSTEINFEAYVSMLRKLVHFHEGGYLSEGLLTLSLSNGFSNFAQLNSIHFLGTYGFMEYLEERYALTKEDVGFFPFPGDTSGETGYTFMLPSSLYINKRTEHEELCRLFFKEYYEQVLLHMKDSEVQPSVFLDSQYSLNPLSVEHSQLIKVDSLADMLLDVITGTLSIESFIERYEEYYAKELLLIP